MSLFEAPIKVGPMFFDERVPIILNLGFSESALPALKKYVELLWNANSELNLFSRQMKFEELIDNHVIDCLLPLKHFPKNISVAADFGAGGGLPGVIYAIQFPNTKYKAFEKSPKKREFLERCKSVAPNLIVEAEIPSDPKSVELVTARAFKPLDVILDMSRDYYKRGGKYFLLKGRTEKIEEELILARKKFKDLEVRIEALSSPVMEVERNLLLINV